jgi:hypothetical protein
MNSRISKSLATALLFALVAVAPAVYAAPAQPRSPVERVTKAIKRIKQFLTTSVNDLIDVPKP